MRAAFSGSPRNYPGLYRQQTPRAASELAGGGGLHLLPSSSLGWLFVKAAELHLAEDALALHLLLKHLEGLSDTVVPDENLHAAFLFNRSG